MSALRVRVLLFVSLSFLYYYVSLLFLPHFFSFFIPINPEFSSAMNASGVLFVNPCCGQRVGRGAGRSTRGSLGFLTAPSKT